MMILIQNVYIYIPIQKLTDDSNQDMIWNHRPRNNRNKTKDDFGQKQILNQNKTDNDFDSKIRSKIT